MDTEAQLVQQNRVIAAAYDQFFNAEEDYGLTGTKEEKNGFKCGYVAGWLAGKKESEEYFHNKNKIL